MENKMEKVISIHQPNFLPWLGYFYKIYKSDVFVILDNVQFAKNSIANRNRIKRVIKEFFRLNRGFLQDAGPEGCELAAMDIVFTVRKGFRVENPAALAEVVVNLLEHKGQSLMNIQ